MGSGAFQVPDCVCGQLGRADGLRGDPTVCGVRDIDITECGAGHRGGPSLLREGGQIRAVESGREVAGQEFGDHVRRGRGR